MKTIKSLKEITTLEVGDKIVFGNLEHTVVLGRYGYYLSSLNFCNSLIFNTLNVSKIKFIESLGISAYYVGVFPEVKSLEALTALVSALFKEYEKQNELPKTWKEFCKRNPIKKEECWIECFDGATLGYADARIAGKYREPDMDRNMCTSKQEAEAFLALMQLRQLRKAYIKDWEPDWEDYHKSKYGVNFSGNQLTVLEWSETSSTLSFPTEKLANQFLNNFKNLLEIAKPLL